MDQVKILKEELTRQRRLNIDLEKQVKNYRKMQSNKQLERVQEDVERLQEEKEYKLRRKFKQVSNALQKPLVFGLTEDLRYGNHKNPVMWFLENQNNK